MEEPENINIQLGDIIEIIAPDSPDLNLQQFYIDYVSSSKLKLVNIENENPIELDINNGEFLDKSITQINLLSRADTPSYARQHNLVPGVWINITFNTPPSDLIVTGIITALEEDSIEIKTYPENDTIYIDFAYQGLPENLSIKEIKIIKDPTTTKIPTALIESSTETPEQPIDALISTPEDDSSPALIESQIQQALLEGNQIQLGEDLEELDLLIDVPESERRYSLEQQTEDLLDELLADIPTNERNNKILNNIHTIIERFLQLRNEYSIFDSNNYAQAPPAINSNYKPIVNSISNFKQNLLWLLPIGFNRKKLYNINKEVITELSTTTVINLDIGETLTSEEEIRDQYIKGQTTIDESKYMHYINEINELYTPFTKPINFEDSIISIPVSTNILTITNNIDDLESITAAATPDTINRTKYLMDTYTPSLIKKTDAQTPADNLTIRSVAILPASFLLFSRIYLPTTSIMTRALLNTNYLFYWKYLTKSKIVDQAVTVDNIDDKESSIQLPRLLQSAKNKMFNDLQEYTLDENLYFNSSTSETYEKFLNTILPTNLDVFKIIKNMSLNQLSTHSVIKNFELFFIYHRDITIDLYQEIANYVLSNIATYKTQLATNITNYTQFSSKTFTSAQKTEWLDILSKHESLNTIVLDSYDLDATYPYTTTELFTRLYLVDYAKLFTIALVRINLDLQTTGLVDDFVRQYQESINAKAKLTNTCKLLTKRYITQASLDSDNNVEIVVDPDLDKTDYNFINKFKKEQGEMSESDFKEFLKTKLLEIKNLSPEDSTREADAIILKQKRVENGDYAILDLPKTETSPPITKYFVRENNIWKDVSDKIGNVKIKSNKLFCNLQENCLDFDGNCVSFEIADATQNENILKKIYTEFDQTYGARSDAIRSNIDKLIAEQITRVRLLKKYKTANLYKYDVFKRSIAATLETEPDVVEQSPFESLRDAILGFEDFVKKQSYIQKFVILYTRKPYQDENQYWLYCIKTNTKLLPLFLSTLANVFISGGDYLYALDVVVTQQGTLSDDGDAFVDKYSGYFIKPIEFDTEEGFTEEGFRLKTREQLEKDLGDAVLELASAPPPTGTVETEEARLVSNVIRAITGPAGMGINISSQKDFIINNVLSLHKQIAPSQQQYDKITARALKEGKKTTSFEDQVGRPLMILTFIFIALAIQTQIPEIEVRKTFPNCVKAFSGYPLFGDDLAGITYIACIARKLKSDIYPWSSIKQLKEDKIVAQMKNILDNDKYKILANPSVKLKLDEKIKYNKTKRKDIKLDIELINKLQGFLPPLIPFTVKTFPLPEGLTGQLARHIKTGSPSQQEQISAIKSKIMIYGLGIQQIIQKIIEKQEPLISSKSSVIFIENSCCNSTSINVHNYFTELDPSIKQFNDISKALEDILYDLKTSVTAPLFFDPLDTAFTYPELPSNFSQDTIYRAFIIFCKSKLLQFSEELLQACGMTPTKADQDLSIEEKIKMLKEEGINYDEELLQKLLTIVNTKNEVKIDLGTNYPNKVQLFNNKLLELDSYPDDQVIPNVLIKELLNVIDSYSLEASAEQDRTRALKNYLDKQNNEMLDTIKLFIKSNSRISKSKYANFKNCLETITDFLEILPDNYTSATDATTFKSIFFMQNSLKYLINVFPNIILNKVNYDDAKIPKHWKLSARHNKDIKDILINYYRNLRTFYDNPELSPILYKIQEKCSNILDLANTTPFFSATNEIISSVFDSRSVLLLFKYYFLLTILTYTQESQLTQQFATPAEVISIAEEQEPTDPEVELTTGEIITTPMPEPVPATIPEEQATQSFITQATLAGAHKEKMTVISNYLISVLEIICGNKDIINYNKETILNKILSSKEKEKQSVTDYLKNLTDEEREVENIFKNQKLEKWGKGLQKGLTQYVKENYDEEREQAEQEMIKDRKLAQKTGISDMNKNIYAYELDADSALAESIDREVYSLEDYPGEDGDEYDDLEIDDDY